MNIYYEFRIKNNSFSYSESNERVGDSAYSTLQKIEYIFGHFNKLKFQDDRKDLILRLKMISQVIVKQYQEKEKKICWLIRFLFQCYIGRKAKRIQEISQRIEMCVPHCLEYPKEPMQYTLRFLNLKDLANFSSVSRETHRIAISVRQEIEAPIKKWVVDVRKLTKRQRDEQLYQTTKQEGNSDKLLCLLVHGANPNVFDVENGDTALHWAAYRNDLEKVVYLLSYGAKPNTRGYKSMTPIQQAYFNQKRSSTVNCIAVMHYFLAQGVDPNQTYEDDKTFLHAAVLHNEMGIVELLLKFRASPKQVDSLGRSALHYAAYQNNTTLIDLLVKAAPEEINRQDSQGQTPLFFVSRKIDLQRGDAGRKNSMQQLLKQGADFTIRDKQNFSLLDHIVYDGQIELAELLLDHGAKINAFGNGKTPLGWACSSRVANVALVRLLLKRGANPHLPMKDGCLPIQIAESNRRHDIADELLKWH